jgi:hypothetical protein
MGSGRCQRRLSYLTLQIYQSQALAQPNDLVRGAMVGQASDCHQRDKEHHQQQYEG